MTDAIRVLHVLGGVGLGGAESRIMDLYRQMNREEIQFDFLVHQNDTSVRKAQFYDEEIRQLGGRIYVLPKFKVYNYAAYRNAVQDFFASHHEFRVVQGHMTSTAGIYLPIAKRFGVPVTVAHSRNAGVDKGLKGIATKFFRRNLIEKADYCFACSKPAGTDVFGEEAVRSGRVKIIHNAIDVEKFRFDMVKRNEMRERLGLKGELKAMLSSAVRLRSGCEVQDCFTGIFARQLVLYLLKRTGIAPTKYVSKLSKKEIAVFAETAKGLFFKITGKSDFASAQVTAGGIKGKEIDTDFMAKKVKGLFLCGEILDIWGCCGGYNLHFAFASGIKAGKSAANFLR